jgi:hypothetical protein
MMVAVSKECSLFLLGFERVKIVNTNRWQMKASAKSSLNAGGFRDMTQFPHDVPHRGIRLQVQRLAMMLYSLGSFGVNVCCNDNGCNRVLIGQGINFANAESFKNLMPLMHESFGERVRGTVCEQDEYHLMNVHAQKPPDKKERNDCKENALNPLACGFGFRLFNHR